MTGAGLAVLAHSILTASHNRSLDADFRNVLEAVARALGDRCFRRGATVFEAPDGSVTWSFFNTLLKLSRRRYGVTHTREHMLGGQKEFDFVPPLYTCGALKRVALLYAFESGPEKKRYVYVKLEGHRAVSLAHGAAAVRAYAVGHVQNSILTRRETDKLNTVAVARDTAAFGQNKSATYNSQSRLGREVFVPVSFTETVLRS